MKILQPYYYDDFKCVGEKCKHTCCEGWTIWIDKKSFYKYKKISGEFGKKINKVIKKNRNRQNDNEYGYFELKESGRCSMLNDSNLCDLYVNKGKGYLCRTCDSHPRLINQYADDMVEKNLQMTCPVVIEYLVTNKDKFEFVLREEKLTESDKRVNVIWGGDSGIIYDLLWGMRESFIEIVQNRNFDMSERLMFVKLFQDKFNEVLEKEDFLESDLQIENLGKYIELLKKINIDNSINVKFNLLEIILNELNTDEQYSDLISALNNFVYIKYKNNKEELQLKFEEFEKYFWDKEYIIENFSVCYLYTHYMNAMENDGFNEVLDTLLFSVCVIKSMAIMIWDKYKKISDEDFEDIIYWVYRNICLNKEYIHNIHIILNAKGYNKLAYAYIFAK